MIVDRICKAIGSLGSLFQVCIQNSECVFSYVSSIQVFYKKAILKNFATFKGKNLLWEFLFNKFADLQVCNFIKKRLQQRCFPVNKKHLVWRTSVDGCFWGILNKAIVPMLVLKLTTIKTHPRSCTKKHRQLSICSSFKPNFVLVFILIGILLSLLSLLW